MLDHTDPVASIIPAQGLESPSDNAMTALSRLALGPVNTDYYIAVFERFDATGRTTTTWNWAACLATISWMVFRQLWTPALVYVAAAEGLALGAFALGRAVLHWPMGVELGVLGAVAVLAFAVPGLYGNALLYADIRKRVARALAASRTLPEACRLLERQASSRKRLQAVVLATGALAAAAVLAFLLWPASQTRPLALEPDVTVAQATAAHTPPSAPPKTLPVGELPPPAQPPVEAGSDEAAPPAATPAASTPASAAPPAPAPAPAPAAAAAPAPTPAAAVTSAPAKPATKAEPKKASASDNHGRRPVASATSAAQAAPATKPAKPAASAATAPAPAPVGSAPGYYINVGLFAEEANARKAQARMLNEGLPAFRQELQGAKGRRIRVRVGPYASRAQANAAAESIRAMALEAVVFKQP